MGNLKYYRVIIFVCTLSLSCSEDQAPDPVDTPSAERKQLLARYDWATEFNEGRAAVRDDQRFFLVTPYGRKIPIAEELRLIDDSLFENGLAVVIRRNKESGGVSHKGYIDYEGRLQIPTKFRKAGPFQGNVALVCCFNKKYGLIGRDGKLIDERFNFENARALQFNDGLARVKVRINKEGSELYGFINKSGELVISPRFKHIKPFEDGVAVNNDALFIRKINTQGKTIAFESKGRKGVVFGKPDVFAEPDFQSNKLGSLTHNLTVKLIERNHLPEKSESYWADWYKVKVTSSKLTGWVYGANLLPLYGNNEGKRLIRKNRGFTQLEGVQNWQGVDFEKLRLDSYILKPEAHDYYDTKMSTSKKKLTKNRAGYLRINPIREEYIGYDGLYFRINFAMPNVGEIWMVNKNFLAVAGLHNTTDLKFILLTSVPYWEGIYNKVQLVVYNTSTRKILLQTGYLNDKKGQVYGGSYSYIQLNSVVKTASGYLARLSVVGEDQPLRVDGAGLPQIEKPFQMFEIEIDSQGKAEAYAWEFVD